MSEPLQEEGLIATLRAVEHDVLAGMVRDPAESLTLLVGAGAGLFYLAESGVNPGVTTYWDAFHYIATSLSVGYSNIFPVTDLGKVVGGLVMMVGPALTSKIFDAASPDPVAAKLDEILVELRRIGGGT